MKNLGITETEAKMFNEISAIIEKYGNQTRPFGMSLIHSHFELSQNEVLHETNDKNKRVLIVKPCLKNELPVESYPTAWDVRENQPKVLIFCCDDGGSGVDAPVKAYQ